MKYGGSQGKVKSDVEMKLLCQQIGTEGGKNVIPAKLVPVGLKQGAGIQFLLDSVSSTE